ncbi:MAG: S41 family peptidase [Ferruginibacter sp.]|nr:S41 family peptidase [Chitinophagaceae bacterium]
MLSLLLLMGCASASQLYDPNKKYSPEELKEDFNVAWDTYRRNHPSLYWYNSKDTVDKGFNDVYGSLKDSLTELEFRNKMAVAVEKIKCGHSSIRLSKGFGKYSAKQKYDSSFPLSMKTWGGDSLVITRNAFRKDSELVRGTVVTAINGKPARLLIHEMSQLISTDGFNNNFKYQVISNSFPVYYRYAFGLGNMYEIEYVAPGGTTKTKQVFNYNPKTDTIQRRVMAPPQGAANPSKKAFRQLLLQSTRSLTIDTANRLGYMLLNSFSKNNLNKFFRQSFQKLNELKIPNLVIELRENGGGNMSKSTRLTRYIIDHPFKVADTAKAASFRYPYPGRVKYGFWYKVEHWIVSPRRGSDGYYHFRQLEHRIWKPFKKNHFDGHVYIITGGYTFSAATLFTYPLKGQRNVTVVGEETGGGAYGNTAVNIPDVVLPNTGIRLRLPLYRLVQDKDLPHDGRGIKPDVYVPPGSLYLKNNVDPKMEKVKELIRERRGSH